VLLGEDSEPEPDLYLRILPEYGGRSATTPDDYIEGAPELIVEVALSSRSIDLYAKRRDYAKCGVREYMVAIPRAGIITWFDLTNDRELTISDDGVIKSLAFPGLWLSVPAILQQNGNLAMTTLNAGLSSSEHQIFVEQLVQRRIAPK
jgi:Uma2 family endonuclease